MYTMSPVCIRLSRLWRAGASRSDQPTQATPCSRNSGETSLVPSKYAPTPNTATGLTSWHIPPRAKQQDYSFFQTALPLTPKVSQARISPVCCKSRALLRNIGAQSNGGRKNTPNRVHVISRDALACLDGVHNGRMNPFPGTPLERLPTARL